ncbi:phage holin family protein [Catalinimonas niigatensis]|uniref:phage holin family protein n=1 Tax=Catalinimonas niigatensis TaxID=1397264 RepID=UPI0026658B00|nr:phage holin family protein [Catalinimonas niigatensis]WPP51305.1 phage holin family protein [Catalinimonas niigatensis]
MRNSDQTPVERLFQHIKEYIAAQRDLLLTIAAKKGGDVIYGIVLAIVLFFLACYFLMIFSIGIAYGIGVLIGSIFWGFMIVALLYLLMAVLIWVLRDKLLRTPIFKIFFKLANTDKEEAHEQE